MLSSPTSNSFSNAIFTITLSFWDIKGGEDDLFFLVGIWNGVTEKGEKVFTCFYEYFQIFICDNFYCYFKLAINSWKQETIGNSLLKSLRTQHILHKHFFFKSINCTFPYQYSISLTPSKLQINYRLGWPIQRTVCETF